MGIKSKIKRLLGRQNVIYCTVTTSAPHRQLEGENVVVTGGASGIGRAVAARAVAEGAKVMILGRREDRLKQVSEELGEGCRYLVCDVTNLRDAEGLYEEIAKHLGGAVSVLVNNAGVYVERPEGEYTVEDYDRMMDTNLKAPFFLTQSYIRYCRQKGIQGNVVMVASNRGLFGDCGPYGMSKAGLINAVQGFARQSIQEHIRVNAVAPGMTASEINHKDVNGDLYTSSAKGGRVLLPEEIAEVVVFLASDRSGCITGAVIPCDEGDSLR